MSSSAPIGTPSLVVLVVTESPWTGRALAAALSDSGFLTIRATPAELALAIHPQDQVDALIIDESSLGNVAAERYTAVPGWLRSAMSSATPMLLLTHDEPSSALLDAAFANGVWGVVKYPLGPTWWLRQLAVWISASRTARRRAAHELVNTTTGLYNASGLEQRARELDAMLRRTGGPVACAVFTLDCLRPWIGDQASTDAQHRHVADICRRVVRASDVLGHVGDADFAVIAPGADSDGVQVLVQRIGRELTDQNGHAALLVRIGTYAVAEATRGLLSVSDMLVHAASRQRIASFAAS